MTANLDFCCCGLYALLASIASQAASKEKRIAKIGGNVGLTKPFEKLKLDQVNN